MSAISNFVPHLFLPGDDYTLTVTVSIYAVPSHNCILFQHEPPDDTLNSPTPQRAQSEEEPSQFWCWVVSAIIELRLYPLLCVLHLSWKFCYVIFVCYFSPSWVWKPSWWEQQILCQIHSSDSYEMESDTKDWKLPRQGKLWVKGSRRKRVSFGHWRKTAWWDQALDFKFEMARWEPCRLFKRTV